MLNDCRYAFDVDGKCLPMTVVRGMLDLDPEADVGEHDLRYASLPLPGRLALGGQYTAHRTPGTAPGFEEG